MHSIHHTQSTLLKDKQSFITSEGIHFGYSQWDCIYAKAVWFLPLLFFLINAKGPIGSPSNCSNVASIAEIISFDLHKPWVYKNLRGDRLRICHTYDCGAREPLPLCQTVSAVGASHSDTSKLKREGSNALLWKWPWLKLALSRKWGSTVAVH